MKDTIVSIAKALVRGDDFPSAQRAVMTALVAMRQYNQDFLVNPKSHMAIDAEKEVQEYIDDLRLRPTKQINRERACDKRHKPLKRLG